MGATDDKTLKIQVLLEEYKTVSAELQQYTQEGMKSFPYAAVLVALYLGWGVSGDPNQVSNFESKIQQYVPYGFVLLCVYFLAMMYVRESLLKYRGYLEDRINQVAEENLMQFDSEYSPIVLERGYLQMGSSWYSRIPTPPFFLALVITMASILIFTSSVIRQETTIVLVLLGGCAFTALYIYLIYPKLLDRIYKQGAVNVRNRNNKGKPRK